MPERAQGLFDYPAQELGLEFVSALNHLKDLCSLLPVIERARTEDDILHRWNDATRY